MDTPKEPEKTPTPASPQVDYLGILKKFLDEQNLEIDLTVPRVRMIEGGAVMIEPPNLVVGPKKNNIEPIKPQDHLSKKGAN